MACRRRTEWRLGRGRTNAQGGTPRCAERPIAEWYRRVVNDALRARSKNTVSSIVIAATLLALGAGACDKSKQGSTATPPEKNAPAQETPAKPAPPAPAPTGPIADRLQQQAGTVPVVFVLGKQGVRAVTADGKLLATLVAQPVDDTAYGSYAASDGIYWYVDQTKLYAIDLRAETASPMLVADQLPAKTFIEIQREIVRPGTFNLRSSTIVATPGAIADPDESQFVRLVWATIPHAEMGELHLVAGKWLADRAKRSMTPPSAPTWKQHIDELPGLDKGFRDCDDRDSCSGADSFGASGWDWFVAKFGDCKNGCKWLCLLYDPSTKKVAVPAAKPAWSLPDDFDAPPAEPYRKPGSCGAFAFDDAGKHYFLRGGRTVCEIGAGCTDMGGTVAGFLRPGALLAPLNSY